MRKNNFAIFFIISMFIVTCVLGYQNLRMHWDKLVEQEMILNEINHELEIIKKKQIEDEIKIEESKEYIEKIKYSILNKVKDHHYDRIIEDLVKVPENYHKKILALCWTESHLDYDIIHKGIHDGSTTGICGIKGKYWNKLMKENDADLNSLYGGYLVLKYLEEKRGSFQGALQSYKGANKNNIAPVNKVLKIMNEI